MLHILASIAFSLVAFGASGLLFAMMYDARHAILAALGLQSAPAARMVRHPVRVRSAGRWQAAAAPAASRSRAAA